MIEELLFPLARGTSPIFEEALQSMLAMGPAVLPDIMRLAQDDEMDDLVFEALSKVGFYVFVQLKDKAEQIAEQVVEQLAKYPEESVDTLVYVLSNPIKVWWEVAVKTLSAIGYPHNIRALPLLLVHACIGNDLAEKEAIQALIALGPAIVVPYLLEALWNQGQAEKYLSISVANICWLLLDSSIARAFVVPCGPIVSHILRQVPSEQPGLKKKLLQVLEKIGPDCAEYALPALLDLVKEEGTTELSMQARRFITTFDQKTLDPYKLILVTLQA